jgi:hypothetical protein
MAAADLKSLAAARGFAGFARPQAANDFVLGDFSLKPGRRNAD